MNAINRTAIILKPQEAFMEWVNKVAPGHEAILSLEDIQQGLFLLPEDDSEDAIGAFLSKHYKQILDEVLSFWGLEGKYPKNRNWELLLDWFQIEIHPTVFDLSDEPIASEKLNAPYVNRPRRPRPENEISEDDPNALLPTENYDPSWDVVKSSKGVLPGDEDAFDRKYEQWEKRDWEDWFEKNLTFPFTVERMEDEDDAYFTNAADHHPFRLGHTMEALEVLEDEYDRLGIVVRVREGKRLGKVPLADCEVRPESDPNYWPVREYVVWMANH